MGLILDYCFETAVFPKSLEFVTTFETAEAVLLDVPAVIIELLFGLDGTFLDLFDLLLRVVLHETGVAEVALARLQQPGAEPIEGRSAIVYRVESAAVEAAHAITLSKKCE